MLVRPIQFHQELGCDLIRDLLLCRDGVERHSTEVAEVARLKQQVIMLLERIESQKFALPLQPVKTQLGLLLDNSSSPLNANLASYSSNSSLASPQKSLAVHFSVEKKSVESPSKKSVESPSACSELVNDVTDDTTGSLDGRTRHEVVAGSEAAAGSPTSHIRTDTGVLPPPSASAAMANVLSNGSHGDAFLTQQVALLSSKLINLRASNAMLLQVSDL